MVTLVLDPLNTPGRVLLEQLLDLIESFRSHRQVKIAGSDELIEFADDGSELLNSLHLYISGVRKAITEDYDRTIVSSAMTRLREAALRKIDNGPSAARAMAAELEDVASDIAKLRSMQAADGMLAGGFMIFRDICRDVEAHFRRVSDGRRALSERVRYVGLGCAGVETDPKNLAAMLVQKLAAEELTELVIARGTEYLTVGERFVEQAVSSSTIMEFRGALYTAGLFFSAAWVVFVALRASPDLPAARRDYVAKAAKVADEKSVRVLTSFIHGVEDRSGNKTRSHQRHVAEVRLAAGDQAATDLVFELIEMKYYYPSFFRSILLQAKAS
jgi:hypothetical protein